MTEKEKELKESKDEIKEAIIAGGIAFVCSAGAAATVGFLVGSQNYEAAGAVTKLLLKPGTFGLAAAAGSAASEAVEKKVRNVFKVVHMVDELIPDEDDEEDEEEEVKEEPKKKK